MKPLIYGYMRRDETARDTDVRQMELALRDYAEHEGYCYVELFQEEPTGERRALTALIEQLKRSAAHHVITPTIDHLSPHPLLRRNLLVQLAEEADARVITLRASVEGKVQSVRDSHPATEKPPRRVQG